jgi:hypothetical protein
MFPPSVEKWLKSAVSEGFFSISGQFSSFFLYINGKKLWEAVGNIATMAATISCVYIWLRGWFCVGKLEFLSLFSHLY